MQGKLVHDMRYLASVVTNCFSAFGDLLGMQVCPRLPPYIAFGSCLRTP